MKNQVILNRAQYDRLQECVARRMGIPESEIPATLAGRYADGGQIGLYTLGECLARGVAASERRLYEFAIFHGIHEHCGIYRWKPEEIDAFCDEMTIRGFLTRESQERVRQGTAAEDDLAAYERGEDVATNWPEMERARNVEAN